MGPAAVTEEPSGLGRRVVRATSYDETTAAAAAAKPLDVLSGSSATPSGEGAAPAAGVPLVEEGRQGPSRNHADLRSGPGQGDEALVWRCPSCEYTYEVVGGEEREGFAAGTASAEIPDSWCGPDCGCGRKSTSSPSSNSALPRLVG